MVDFTGDLGVGEVFEVSFVASGAGGAVSSTGCFSGTGYIVKREQQLQSAMTKSIDGRHSSCMRKTKPLWNLL